MRNQTNANKHHLIRANDLKRHCPYFSKNRMRAFPTMLLDEFYVKPILLPNA